jgi:hypothetical protein
MVWRDLTKLGSSGPPLHGSSHEYTELERNIAKEQGRENSKLKFDDHGPHVFGTSPKVAHYALRVEVRSLSLLSTRSRVCF